MLLLEAGRHPSDLEGEAAGLRHGRQRREVRVVRRLDEKWAERVEATYPPR
ncbi:MAG: hypothetical protein AB7O97_14220 [Planctomycetota bacterium]